MSHIFSEYHALIRNLNTNQLIETLEYNGLRDCCDIIRAKEIDGNAFLDLTHQQLSTWRNILNAVQITRLWSVVQLAQSKPTAFLISFNEPQKPSVPVNKPSPNDRAKFAEKYPIASALKSAIEQKQLGGFAPLPYNAVEETQENSQFLQPNVNKSYLHNIKQSNENSYRNQSYNPSSQNQGYPPNNSNLNQGYQNQEFDDPPTYENEGFDNSDQSQGGHNVPSLPIAVVNPYTNQSYNIQPTTKNFNQKQNYNPPSQTQAFNPPSQNQGYNTSPAKNAPQTKGYNSHQTLGYPSPINNHNQTKGYNPSPINNPNQTKGYSPTPINNPNQTKGYNPSPINNPNQTKGYNPSPINNPNQTKGYNPSPINNPNQPKSYNPNLINNSHQTKDSNPSHIKTSQQHQSYNQSFANNSHQRKGYNPPVNQRYNPPTSHPTATNQRFESPSPFTHRQIPPPPPSEPSPRHINQGVNTKNPLNGRANFFPPPPATNPIIGLPRPPIGPPKHDSDFDSDEEHIQDDRPNDPFDYRTQEWYRNISRKESEALLSGQDDGTFVVRPSRIAEHECTISIMCNLKKYHLGIRRHEGKLLLGNNYFDSMNDIVETFLQQPIVLSGPNDQEIPVILKL